MRFWIRLTLIPLVMVLFALIACPAKLFPRRARVFWSGVMLTACTWCLCRIMGIRVKVTGDVPSRPALVVSNHLSYVDILVMASVMPSVFVAKSEVRDWPGIGLMCRAYDTIFFERKNFRAIPLINARMKSVIESGQRVVFFPEGTSTSGADVLPFNPALFDAAAEHQWPIYAACLGYHVPQDGVDASLAVCWWGEMEFTPHFQNLLRLKSVEARIHFCPGPVQGMDRKRLAIELQGMVAGACRAGFAA